MNFEFYQKSIVTLVGTSYSGKSTIAAKLAELAKNQNKTVHVISSDEIRKYLLQLGVDDNIRTNKGLGVSEQAFQILKVQLESVVSFPVNSDLIIIDTTGLDEVFRKYISSVAQQNQYHHYLMVFDFVPSFLKKRCSEDPLFFKTISIQQDRLRRKVFPVIVKKDFTGILKIRKEINLDQCTLTFNTNNVKSKVYNKDHDLDYCFFIGDIHECVDELKLLVDRIKTQYQDKKYVIYSIGDWIDKGNNTKGIIEYLTNNPEIQLINGNHEQYVFTNINKPDYVYQENEETSYFSSLQTLLNDVELKQKFNDLYNKSYDFVQIDLDCLQAFITHSPCPEKYLGKVDNRSVKRMRKEDFKWDSPTVEQIPYIFTEAVSNKPLHIFGHISIAKTNHIYKNKICIDQGCVQGHTLTALSLDLNTGRYDFIYQDSLKGKTENLLDFKHVLDKKVDDSKKYENIDPLALKQINRLLAQKVHFISPTMSPAPSYYDTNSNVFELETPATAINYFLNKGITQVIAQTKYMGSRCQVYIYPELENCFAVSRNGWRIKQPFIDELVKQEWLKYKDKIVKDFIITDNELLPWFALGEGLIKHSFTPYYNFIHSELQLLQQYSFDQFNIIDINANIADINKFKIQLDIYGSEKEPYLKTFGIIYNGESYLDKPLDKILSEYSIDYEYFDLSNEIDQQRLIEFYENQTKDGQTEGIVIKPNVWNSDIIPYMKVRNPEYLRLVYGFNYQTDIKRHTMSKNISSKALLSIKEQVLNQKLLNSQESEENRFKIIADIVNMFEREKTLDPKL